MPVYGELGRYPLSIKIKQRMVRYWSRILKVASTNLIRSCIQFYVTFTVKMYTCHPGLDMLVAFFETVALITYG